MRAIVAFLSALALVAMLGSPAGAEIREVPVDVEFGEQAQGSSAAAVDCSGFAPEDMLCTGSFEITGAFGITIGFSFTYYGTLELRGQTPTGSVTVFCDMIFTGPPEPCSYDHEGFFMEGQTFSLTSLATGFGYWSVRAPT